MKHTTGQWVSHQIEETDEFAIFSLDTFIAQTENPMVNEEPTKSEKQANATLIASAPEMLVRLKELQFNLLAEDCDGNSLAKNLGSQQMERLAKTIARSEDK